MPRSPVAIAQGTAVDEALDHAGMSLEPVGEQQSSGSCNGRDSMSTNLTLMPSASGLGQPLRKLKVSAKM